MFALLVKFSALSLPLVALMAHLSRLKFSLDSSPFSAYGPTRADQWGAATNKRPLLLGTQSWWLRQYDYIIVGAGSAGSVLANRLSEQPNVQVLLLEAGGNENFLTDIPIAYQLLQKSSLDWAYQTESQSEACWGLRNRSSFWPRGRVLGGTSALNVMLYTRGNPNDYERWPEGWRWRDVFPYFLKSENNLDAASGQLAAGFHARGGPLDVRRTPHVTPLGEAFVEAAPELGYPRLADLNGPSQSGFAVPQTTNRRGARCSTAKAFLYPARARPNLHILALAFVTQLIWGGGRRQSRRALGVRFDRLGRRNVEVFARREVILAGGAINSAQLLLLSGVGPARELRALGVPLVADLPVGRNLQDHIYPGGLHFAINKPVSLSQRRVFTAPNLLAYALHGTGPLASTGVDGLAFVSTPLVARQPRTRHLDWPDIQMHMVPADVVADGGRYLRHLAGLDERLWRHYYRHFRHTSSFSIDPVLLRPKSRGWVRLRSRDPYQAPRIDPRYLTHPDDVRTMVAGMRLAIDIGHSRAFRARFGARLFPLAVPGCERLGSGARPTDAYLECVARTLTWTIYHPVGTCKMALHARDPNAVVDAQLRVLGGVRGLRVVDASVMPYIVSANTNAPTIMIAERAADLIRFPRAARCARAPWWACRRPGSGRRSAPEPEPGLTRSAPARWPAAPAANCSARGEPARHSYG